MNNRTPMRYLIDSEITPGIPPIDLYHVRRVAPGNLARARQRGLYLRRLLRTLQVPEEFGVAPKSYGTLGMTPASPGHPNEPKLGSYHGYYVITRHPACGWCGEPFNGIKHQRYGSEACATAAEMERRRKRDQGGGGDAQMIRQGQ